MSTVPLIQYEDASAEVRQVYEDIMRIRNVKDVNNFWKALANHPEILKRTWNDVRQVMQPGAIDGLAKEMIYIAVSIANNCDYCIHSHTASAFAKGMTPDQYQELLSVIALASQTNTLANGMRVPVDEAYQR